MRWTVSGNKRGLHGSVREVCEPAWCVSRKYVEWYASVEFVGNDVPNAGYRPQSGAQLVGTTVAFPGRLPKRVAGSPFDASLHEPEMVLLDRAMIYWLCSPN